MSVHPAPLPVGTRVQYTGPTWSRWRGYDRPEGHPDVVAGDIGVVVATHPESPAYPGLRMPDGRPDEGLDGWSTVRFHDEPQLDVALRWDDFGPEADGRYVVVGMTAAVARMIARAQQEA